jgi:hypothetical protein
VSNKEDHVKNQENVRIISWVKHSKNKRKSYKTKKNRTRPIRHSSFSDQKRELKIELSFIPFIN